MVTVRIFSRDRPMHLLCTLETLLAHGHGLEDTTIQVLVCVDDGFFVADFRLDEIRGVRDRHEDVLGVSLQLGRNCSDDKPVFRPREERERSCPARSSSAVCG